MRWMLTALEFGVDAGLFADFICRDPIKLFVAFNRNDFRSIRIYGMVCAFPEKLESVLFEMQQEVTTLDRYFEPQWEVAR